MDYNVRLATVEDILWLAPRLREADVAEIAAASGRTPLSVLVSGLADSAPCLVGTADGVPVAAFGIVPVTGSGAVWLLSTPALETHASAFLRRSRGWLDAQQIAYPTLTCTADARNTLHARLITWAGFKRVGVSPAHGRARTPFIHYERHRNV